MLHSLFIYFFPQIWLNKIGLHLLELLILLFGCHLSCTLHYRTDCFIICVFQRHKGRAKELVPVLLIHSHFLFSAHIAMVKTQEHKRPFSESPPVGSRTTLLPETANWSLQNPLLNVSPCTQLHSADTSYSPLHTNFLNTEFKQNLLFTLKEKLDSKGKGTAQLRIMYTWWALKFMFLQGQQNSDLRRYVQPRKVLASLIKIKAKILLSSFFFFLILLSFRVNLAKTQTALHSINVSWC